MPETFKVPDPERRFIGYACRACEHGAGDRGAARRCDCQCHDTWKIAWRHPLPDRGEGEPVE